MRNPKVNYLAVGSFVLMMMLTMIVVVSLLTGRSVGTETYYAHYDNVADVKFGTQVLYEGYPIGQVEQVEPIKEDGRIRFKVELSVFDDWKIPDDSVAQIASSGLLAPVTINIQAGVSDRAYASQSTLASKGSADVFSVMSAVASQVADLSEESIKPLLNSLNNTVNSFGGLVDKDVSGLVQELTTLVQALNQDAPGITRHLNQFSENLSMGSNELRAMIGAVDPEQLRSTMGNMTTSAANFSTLSQDLQSSREQLDLILQGGNEVVNDNKAQLKASVGHLYHVLDSLANHIDSMNHNLDRTVRNMNEFSARIRQNPSLLISADSPRDEASR